MPSEFSIIKTFFADKSQQKHASTKLGIGDDGAIVTIPDNQEMVIVVDTLVEGVHFPQQTSARDIAYKALAVNLSDLAAMGAEPSTFTLALTLPQSLTGEGEKNSRARSLKKPLKKSQQNANWLKDFSEGLFELAAQANIELIGGDTTQGPLTVTIQAHGLVPKNKALLRSGAHAGDLIFVSGTLGDAAVGLQCAQHRLGREEKKLSSALSIEEKQYCLNRLNRPQPRLKAGFLLRGIATSCIDISDGLLADLGHICAASRCRATINAQNIPLSPVYKKHYAHYAKGESVLGVNSMSALAATAGDDYELCFTVSPEAVPKLLALDLGCPISQIGEVCALEEAGSSADQAGAPRPMVVLLDKTGNIIPVAKSGYSHF